VLGHSGGGFGWKSSVLLLAGAGLVVVGAARVALADEDETRHPGLERWLPWLAIAVAGLFVLWSRLDALNQSLWHDEVFSIVNYTSKGPSEILFGDYVPNDHVLFNLLAWPTAKLLGESEVSYRLWSVVPAIAAGAVIVWWAWGALGRWTAAIVALLVAFSPVHHDLAREARGYGLGFLAGALMLVFAYRVARGGARRDFWVLGLAGVVGTFTLPQFAIAYLGQAVPLLTRRDLRVRVLVMLGAVGAVVLLLYAPVLSDIIDTSDTVSGGPLSWHAPVTGPLEHLLQPNLDLLAHRPTDAYAIVPNRPDQVIAGTLALVGAIMLWRAGSRMLLALLLVPLPFTYTVLTLGRFHVHERYGSFLLFHALLLAAVGIVGLVRAYPAGRLRYAAAGVAVLIAAITLVRAVDRSRDYHDLPRENFKRVAEIVDGHPARRILTDSARPEGLRYYLPDRDLVVLPRDQLEAAFCSSHPPRIYIEHPFRGADEPPPPSLTCLERKGAVRIRARQRDRDQHIDVWLLPNMR
jgi:Dolichyl-phosphate-mannose-protein mannosyltransferase